MPTVDLGVDFEDVKDSDQIQPMPAGVYEFQVESVEPKTASTGRPMLKWTLSIINNEEFKGRKLFNNTVLPWTNPQTGEKDINVFGLVAQCKAVGVPWTGMSLNTEDYVGRPGQVEVVQKKKQTKQINPDTGQEEWMDDDDAPPVNDIKKFIY